MVLEKLAGESIAREVARKLHYPFTDSAQFESPNIKFKDALWLLTAAYQWHKQNIGVFLNNGIDEINLTAVVDTYPQSFTAKTISIAPERKIIHSQYGLNLVPRYDLATATKLDRLLVLDNQPHLDLDTWAKDKFHLEPESLSSFSQDDNRFIFDSVLQDLARRENQPIAEIVAKVVEFPLNSLELEGKGVPIWLFFKLLAIAIISLTAISLWVKVRTVKQV
ncbi:MAG: hypothetical protein ACFCAD_25290 [Pleurocapsa sp.]